MPAQRKWLGMLLSAWLVLVVWGCDSSGPAPHYHAMKAHVLRRLSDEDIRRLHAESKVEYVKLVRQRALNEVQAKERKKEETAAREKKCADEVYRTRNDHECRASGQIFTDGPFTTGNYLTEEIVFERMMMGVCLSVPTIVEARKNNCLP